MADLQDEPHTDYAALDRGESRRLEAIPGNVPSPRRLPPGCTAVYATAEAPFRTGADGCKAINRGRAKVA